MTINSKKKKVYVGLSGGVDSSVAASLLKEQGYDVVGVFIKVWQPDFIACTWKEDRLDAMRVAAKIDIPFQTLDLESVYKTEVIDYMMEEYRRGYTPNPDVMCNKYVKFGAFLEYALSQGADYVATGHYARVCEKDNQSMLCEGLDKNKDQSYFLWTLTPHELNHVLFPVGEYEKPYVREIAANRGLITAGKKDSQGLCFIGKLNFREFLKRYIPEKKGEVLSVEGEVIGSHEGAYLYTVGQRHGFETFKQTTEEKPYYIVSKNIIKNELVVSHKDQLESSGATEVVCQDIVWNTSDTPKDGLRVLARVRYRQNKIAATVYDNGRRVTFETPQIVDVGQSVVVYLDDICVGGAVIDSLT